jgi:hypothetical protein
VHFYFSNPYAKSFFLQAKVIAAVFIFKGFTESKRWKRFSQIFQKEGFLEFKWWKGFSQIFQAPGIYLRVA